MRVTKQFLVPIDLNSIFHNMEVNGDQLLFGYPHFSKYILCSAEKNNS